MTFTLSVLALMLAWVNGANNNKRKVNFLSSNCYASHIAKYAQKLVWKQLAQCVLSFFVTFVCYMFVRIYMQLNGNKYTEKLSSEPETIVNNLWYVAVLHITCNLHIQWDSF